MEVGRVKSLAIEGDHVLVGFSLAGREIGTDSRMAIRTETILGRRAVEIEPRGEKVLKPMGVLPVGQTTTPYQLYDAVFDLTKASQGWDLDTVKQSLNVLSETIDQTYPHLSAALDGVARFSDTIGKRDDQFKQLLANANKVAAVLGNRSEQINRLAVNAQTLLAAINDRGRAIDYLLQNVSEISQQFAGFINDNPNLNHVLEQLHTISDELVKHKVDLADSFITASKFMGALAEAIGSGPYFKTLVVNLVPYQILQPWVDAAFKKRGIDPEEFWRNAGLPAFRFPDPNGQRQANGAPPPGPQILEGTPDHPGPAVGPGSPCSYTPPADGIPTPANPLPCAGLTQGPFGGPAYPGADIAISSPNPAAVGGPGVPSAAFPGELSPNVPVCPPPPLAPGPPGSTHRAGRPAARTGHRHPRLRPAAERARRTDPASGTGSAGPAGRWPGARRSGRGSLTDGECAQSGLAEDVADVRDHRHAGRDPRTDRGAGRLPAVQEGDHQHRGRLLLRSACPLSR